MEGYIGLADGLGFRSLRMLVVVYPCRHTLIGFYGYQVVEIVDWGCKDGSIREKWCQKVCFLRCFCLDHSKMEVVLQNC